MKSFFAQYIASGYCYEHGWLAPTSHYVENDTEMAKRIATAYENLPVFSHDELTLQAYEYLRNEVIQQWNYCIDSGATFEAWKHEGQPYENSTEMVADVVYNHHLYYFTGGEVHPLLGEVNNMFRAVHDFFGHAAEGYQFGPRGEHNAWIHHSMMFSSLAQKALTTETRGQNSWVNYGPYSHLAVRERPFAENKVALLPDEFCDWYRFLMEY